MASQPKIRCRQITEADFDAVADLLVRSFSRRDRAYWLRGLDRQAKRARPPELPAFGYLLDNGGQVVGALLLLSVSIDVSGRTETRCNLSSWCVDPEYRSFASLLASFAQKHKGVTYLNISPARHTWPIIEAQGFEPFSLGQFTAFPFLGPRVGGVRLSRVEAGQAAGQSAVPEFELLQTHAGYGCISLVCSAPDGDHPFVLQPYRRIKGHVPCAQLVYCRDVDDFVRFAGPLGRYLLRRGIPWVVLDANGPVKGLVGFYEDAKSRKFFKGPHKPRLGDLAYTEFALFGP